MKKLFTLLLLCVIGFSVNAQSRSVEQFRDNHKPSLKLFFYKSTLKMFSRMQDGFQNQFLDEMKDLPQLSAMVDGIEKIKFFNYEDWNSQEDQQLFSELTSNIQKEGYETLVSARVQGNDMNVMMKEWKGKPQGFVVIVRMETGYSIIDIEGYPDVNKILALSQFINQGSSSLSLSEAFK